MPVFDFLCENCQKELRVLRKAMPESVPCDTCKAAMKRKAAGGGASARIVEVLDNGLMTRRVERLADAERLFKERVEQDKKARGG